MVILGCLKNFNQVFNNINNIIMAELKEIAEIIKQKNPTVGEVLLEKVAENNIDAFAKILANFIKLNYQP